MITIVQFTNYNSETAYLYCAGAAAFFSDLTEFLFVYYGYKVKWIK
jgi:hypothetical protein